MTVIPSQWQGAYRVFTVRSAGIQAVLVSRAAAQVTHRALTTIQIRIHRSVPNVREWCVEIDGSFLRVGPPPGSLSSQVGNTTNYIGHVSGSVIQAHSIGSVNLSGGGVHIRGLRGKLRRSTTEPSWNIEVVLPHGNIQVQDKL